MVEMVIMDRTDRTEGTDSPDLVAWRFADYPEEEEEEEDYEEDWEAGYQQPAWLRISSEQLVSLQGEDLRSPLTAPTLSSPHPGLRRSLSCVEISSPLNTANYPNLFSPLSNSPSHSPPPRESHFTHTNRMAQSFASLNCGRR